MHRLPSSYDRYRDLPKLLPVEYALLSVGDAVSAADLIAFLRRALRRERTRGTNGHWSYDLGRHAALLNAYRTELASFVGAGKNPGWPGGPTH